MAKDEIKERLFDELGSGDRAWSQRLGRATYAVMFHWIEEELRAGRALVAEANFTPSAAPRFARLPSHRSLQLLCTAPREVVIERYAARRRHGGHLDDVVVRELRAGEHEDQWLPIPLAGEVVELDAVTADLDAVAARVRERLQAGSADAVSALE